jgi:hypothetical protein
MCLAFLEEGFVERAIKRRAKGLHEADEKLRLMALGEYLTA